MKQFATPRKGSKERRSDNIKKKNRGTNKKRFINISRKTLRKMNKLALPIFDALYNEGK